MKTLVQELQQKLLDHHVSTLESLRLALYVAKKLRLSDLEKWVNAELNGYKNSIKIPSYRHIPCQLKGWKNIKRIWVRGFEPPTPYTPCKCASQAALHPEKNELTNIVQPYSL